MIPSQNLIHTKVCTFVNSWTSPQITPNTFRLYGKRAPAIEAAKCYVQQVRNTLHRTCWRERIADDAQVRQRSRQE